MKVVMPLKELPYPYKDKLLQFVNKIRNQFTSQEMWTVILLTQLIDSETNKLPEYVYKIKELEHIAKNIDAEWSTFVEENEQKELPEQKYPRIEKDASSGWTIKYCGNCGKQFWRPDANYCEVCGCKVKK